MKKIKTNWVFIITLITSIALAVAGFIIPPTGIVDGSVITVIGLLEFYAVIAQIPHLMQRGSNITISKGNARIDVNNTSKQHD